MATKQRIEEKNNKQKLAVVISICMCLRWDNCNLNFFLLSLSFDVQNDDLNVIACCLVLEIHVVNMTLQQTVKFYRKWYLNGIYRFNAIFYFVSLSLSLFFKSHFCCAELCYYTYVSYRCFNRTFDFVICFFFRFSPFSIW